MRFMFIKPGRRSIAVLLIFLIVAMGGLMSPAMAETAKVSDQQVEIAEPQTQLSPEVDLPAEHGSWIAAHKWWVIAGVTALVSGVVIATTGGDENKDDNSGQIYGEW